MKTEKLVYMANQIGSFFKSQGDAVAVAGIADHIKQFWDPRMRAAIFAHVDAGGAGLQPLVLQALQTLKTGTDAASSLSQDNAGAVVKKKRGLFGLLRN